MPIRRFDLYDQPGAEMVLRWARSAASPAFVVEDWLFDVWWIG